MNFDASESLSGDAVASDFLSRLDRMRIYVSPNGHRAVHKPLLVLLMLARVQQLRQTRVSLDEIEEPFEHLITEFGLT